MKDDKTLESQIKHSLDSSVDDLPEHIQARLAQARAEALKAKAQKGKVIQFKSNWTKELLAVAACVSLIVPIWLNTSSDHSTSDGLPSQGLDLMVSLAEMDDEEWELVDDLEFALWLNEQSIMAEDVKST